MGRVQTPTLAMVVERELAIRRFVPEDYLEVAGRPSARQAVAGENAYKGTWVRDATIGRNRRRLPLTAWRRSADRRAGANREGGDRIHRSRNAAHGAAAALRS